MMRALALFALAVLAAAALAREACRHVARACIAVPRACRRAVVRVGAAVEAFAYAHVTSPVVWEVEPEPTVSDDLQWRLDHEERRQELLAADRDRTEQLIAGLQARMEHSAVEHAAFMQRHEQEMERLNKLEQEQARDAMIAEALHADAVWRVKTAGLAFEPRFTPSARGN